ncbi:MAG: hypothetical protein WC869_16200 [Phycisphaerae bacterium]|jgi:hypothetical protein
MPCCLVAALFMFGPRVVLFLIWILTNWFSAAYLTVLWPLLGFIFMPYTTMAYMAAMLNNHGTVSGGWLVLVVLAVLVDLGVWGGGSQSRTRLVRKE